MTGAVGFLELVTAAEYGVYQRAASRSRLAYVRKHGGLAVQRDPGGSRAAHVMAVREHAASWRAEHGEARETSAHKAGVSAVRKLHNGRIAMAETGRAAGADPAHVAELERWAAEARERLAVLGLVKAPRAPRKSAKPAAVPASVPETVPADVVPETVPVAMPEQTRAARRASNRELAERMRAAGLTPSGVPWQLAQAGVPLDQLAGMTAADMLAAVTA